ncbi:hypothetical protein EX30DRAFT_210022 [Ascodesmis nigricans]|uniref:Uncharacterized protein n=1 Tax=Ascodesmis nigricans TaxID=341454 RepID=A0A4V3SHQ5_9PEZI|nr:hypothetical protein EX30DRAFT_210022 [Ascodesmis nigricans]
METEIRIMCRVGSDGFFVWHLEFSESFCEFFFLENSEWLLSVRIIRYGSFYPFLFSPSSPFSPPTSSHHPIFPHSCLPEYLVTEAAIAPHPSSHFHGLESFFTSPQRSFILPASSIQHRGNMILFLIDLELELQLVFNFTTSLHLSISLSMIFLFHPIVL